MAVPSAPTLVTTTTAALTADARTVPLTAVTSLAAGDALVIGREMMRVISINGLNVGVRRGIAGTAAVAHVTSIAAQGGPSAEFGVDNGQPYRAGYTGVLGSHAKLTYPLLSIYKDPDTGFEYRVCKAAAALTVNEWVMINPSTGVATQAPASEAGVVAAYIGIVIEAAAAAGDVCFIKVSGQHALAEVTAGTIDVDELGLGAVAGHASIWAAANGVLIHNAGLVTTVSAGTATVLLNHAFSDGATSI